MSSKTGDNPNGTTLDEKTADFEQTKATNHDDKLAKTEKAIEKKSNGERVEDPAKIQVKNVGVWSVYSQQKPWLDIPGMGIFERFRGIMAAFPYLWRFSKEIWSLAPGHLILWAVLQFINSVDGVVSLWVTANLLDTMQSIILTGKVDMQAVRFTLTVRFLYYVFQWLNEWISFRNSAILSRRIERHCSAKLLKTYARMDLATLQRKDVQSSMKSTSSSLIGGSMWNNFSRIVSQIMIVFEVVSRAYFLINFFSRQANGWQLGIVCILSPTLSMASYMDDFSGGWFAYASNQAYLRLRSLADIAFKSEYIEEVITSGLGDYIQREYLKAMKELGDVDYHNIHTILRQEVGFKAFLRIFSDDITLLYYFASVVRNPASFSLTSLTVLRESANSLLWTIYRLFDGGNRLKETMRLIEDYYTFLELDNAMVDGDLAFPASRPLALPAQQEQDNKAPGTPDDSESQNEQDNQGMKIEFKNVSMQYPGNTAYALKNVSFVIPAGATVILVGANGSGKTTTVSLLSRLLDPTDGEILINDIPIKQYKVQTVRRAQAILRQEYKHFPLSLTENIGIGDPDWLGTHLSVGADKGMIGQEKEKKEERVMRAAKMGGAAEIVDEIRLEYNKKRKAFLEMANNRDSVINSTVVTKEKDTKDTNGVKSEDDKESGWNIMVTPVRTWTGSWLPKGSKLKEMSEGVEKKLQLSGGQWQRLALARLFMRAEGDDIRMICADEPSAALDPRAEYEVFERLRTLKGRKTTRIFITHRFGHLTKHADLILTLKNGELVEAGSHEELMKADGEYANLYNIQAQAFASG